MMDSKKLKDLEKQADDIKKVKKIMNTILANGCFSEKEQNNQYFRAFKQGKITDSETKILKKGWDFRRKQARILEKKLMELLDDEKDKK